MHRYFHLGKRSYYPWIFLVSVILINTAIYYLIPEAKALELYLPATGGIASFVYFLYAKHNQDIQLFVSLFKEFNARYDLLNEKLNAIADSTIACELSYEDKAVLFDYFNLCAEEYLFYKAGYIDQDVWHSWFAGMKYFARNKNIRSFWESDLKTGSYYGFTIELFNEKT